MFPRIANSESIEDSERVIEELKCLELGNRSSSFESILQKPG